MSRATIFFFVLFILFAYTAFKASQLWPSHRYLASLLAIPVFAIIVGWQFLYRTSFAESHTGWFQILAWTGSIGMGVWATFLILSLPFDLLNALASIFGRKTAFMLDPERRKFLSYSIPVGLLGVSGGITALGAAGALLGPKVKAIPVTIAGLPADLRGLKIAQISDLHVGPTIKRSYVESVVAKTNALNPDLIVVTGDLADGTPASLESHVEPLGGLKARLGVFYITGNHEYYWGAERWLEKVRSLGMTPLINENRILSVGNEKVLIAGITDPSGAGFITTHRSDPKKSLESKTDSALKILLAHRPDCYDDAEKLGFHLQLSGHTHAGQFFPWSIFVALAHKHYRGLTRLGNLWLYINPGTGYWGPAHRFLVPSEISLISLA